MSGREKGGVLVEFGVPYRIGQVPRGLTPKTHKSREMLLHQPLENRESQSWDWGVSPGIGGFPMKLGDSPWNSGVPRGVPSGSRGFPMKLGGSPRNSGFPGGFPLDLGGFSLELGGSPWNWEFPGRFPLDLGDSPWKWGFPSGIGGFPLDLGVP